MDNDFKKKTSANFLEIFIDIFKCLMRRFRCYSYKTENNDDALGDGIIYLLLNGSNLKNI